MEDFLEIGKIANSHGVKGEVKIIPLTDNPERYNDLEWVYIDKEPGLQKYDIEGVKYFKGFVILKLKGINSIDDAEKLKGLFLKINRENAVRLPEHCYFICDLIGCEVFEENGSRLGELKNVIGTGSNDVYIVKDEKGKEILIPALKSVVELICIEDKKIVVSLPKGLIDDEI